MTKQQEILTRVIVFGIIIGLVLLGIAGYKNSRNGQSESIYTSTKNTVEEDTEDLKDTTAVDYMPGWHDNFNGLISQVNKVEILGNGTITITMTLKNTAKGRKFITYPNQMTVITPDGKQEHGNFLTGDDLGGDIYDGVTKSGSFDVYTENPDAINFDQLRLIWDVTDGKTYKTKKYDVKLKLQ